MIVLDTHVLLWATTDDRRLGRKARVRIERARAIEEALVSSISFWEIGMLVASGRLKLAMSVDELRSVTLRAGVSEAVVRGDIAIMATRLEGMHADPADRLITATALVMNATLLTADAAILGMKAGPSRLDAQT